ncbi:MAG: peptidase U34 [Rhodospirillales bacterium]|jgi:secernin|nr:peptidase U34 [Rhodospirillales bacterium]
MCDTIVALAAATASGNTLFAKNSDRDANEAQIVEVFAGQHHAPGTSVKLTYIEIPQVPHTHNVLLSRPYWMWGAEMGANEHGLAIGNEAIQSCVSPSQEPGLIGMDIVRLALERTSSAAQAVALICELIETYGQSGNCGHPQSAEFYYHNSFLIADRSSAFVLETLGHEWISEKVSGVRSISNTLTIGEEYLKKSVGLEALAEIVGWKQGQQFNFREIFSPKPHNPNASGPQRWRRTSQCLRDYEGRLTPLDMIGILRDRGETALENPDWRPDGDMNGTICAHASFGPARRFGQTVGSQVSLLGASGDKHFVTATAAPDMGIFKPITLNSDHYPTQLAVNPSGVWDPHSLWWQHEKLHRAVLKDYAARLKSYQLERDQLEEEFVEAASSGSYQDIWNRAGKALADWIDLVESIPPVHPGSSAYQEHWRQLAQRAEFPTH